MSEYQFVHFLAIDRPLDEKQLEFMRRQSSRADISKWELTNEYHYGDFHGNAREMLKRGYDVHLHYANYGLRKLMFRFPAEPPCSCQTFKKYLVKYGVEWVADKKGKGGILEIAPDADAGSYDEILYDADEILPEIAPVRDLLVGGDLRALYLAWLACSRDEEALEPPVPAGLGELTPALHAMAAFYELSEDLLAAVAEGSPPSPKSADAQEMLKDWIDKQSIESLRELVRRFLADDAAATRSETLSRIRDDMGALPWPTAEPTRTLAQLRESAEALRERRLEKEQKSREAAYRKRLAAIAADPRKAIANIEKLVKERSLASYEKAAEALVELRDALGADGPARARAVAEKLRSENPRLNQLTATLRRHDLLK
jgi:hypothetical protein